MTKLNKNIIFNLKYLNYRSNTMDNRKILIIIPTYNEKENIEDIIKAIFKNVDSLNVNILVVDDNSPDGTANIVKEMMRNLFNNRLFIFERKEKAGLASAYIAGFKCGIEKGYDIFIEMDADFSHNPVYLKEMIKLSETNDVVIASRNIKGGGVKGWGLIRNIISKGGSLYSRMV